MAKWPSLTDAVFCEGEANKYPKDSYQYQEMATRQRLALKAFFVGWAVGMAPVAIFFLLELLG